MRRSAEDASFLKASKEKKKRKKKTQTATPSSSARATNKIRRSCAFTGVTRDRRYWRAQTSSGEYIGTFRSESAAAAAVADRLQVRQADLRRKRAKTTDIDDHIEKFKLLLGVYTDTDSDNIAVMSDLVSAAEAMQKWPLMCVCAPALHFASLMGKVGPWKQEIGSKWSKVFRLHAEESECPKVKAKQSLLSSVTLRSLQLVEVSSDALGIPASSQTHFEAIPRRYYYCDYFKFASCCTPTIIMASSTTPCLSSLC